jgi:hypothetical protein
LSSQAARQRGHCEVITASEVDDKSLCHGFEHFEWAYDWQFHAKRSVTEKISTACSIEARTTFPSILLSIFCVHVSFPSCLDRTSQNQRQVEIIMSSKDPVVCVFCGSSAGNRPDHIESARVLANSLADANYKLVYGGGTMGIVSANRSCVGSGEANCGHRWERCRRP